MRKQTSMSAIKTFLECRRRYYYDYVIGLKPRVNRQSMEDGTRIHNLLEAGYSRWMEDRGAKFLDRARAKHVEECSNKETDAEKAQMYWDVVKFYWDNTGRHDSFDDILLVETPVVVTFDNFDIRCTFDLLVQQEGMLNLIDHKTADSISDEIAFMRLDFQLRMYAFAVWMIYKKWGKLLHNMIRRSVPSELTKTGRVSKASKDVRDYNRREPLFFTEVAIMEFSYELGHVLNAMAEAHESGVYLRSPSKAYTGCGGCSYRTVCESEYNGQPLRLSNAGVKMMFRVAEDPLSKS